MYLGEAVKKAGPNGKIYREGAVLVPIKWKGPEGFTTEELLADNWRVAKPRHDLLTAIEIAMSKGRGCRVYLGTPGHHIVLNPADMESCEWEVIENE